MLRKKNLGILLAIALLMSAVMPISVFASEVATQNVIEVPIHPAWVMPGSNTQYPSEGGVWEYGFWDVKYRSYYTVDRCHGSTVISGDRTSRSIDTASGETSIAELWAVNNPKADPHYYYRVCD